MNGLVYVPEDCLNPIVRWIKLFIIRSGNIWPSFPNSYHTIFGILFFTDAAKAALIGGASNFLTGKALFNAVNSLVGNLASQVNNPCFDGVNFKQAAVASLLGAYNLGSRITQPNLLSKAQVAAQQIVTQRANQRITGFVQ